MHDRQRLLAGLMVLVTGPALMSFESEARQSTDAAVDLDSLVKGTLARTEALFSGRIEYNLNSGFPQLGRTLEPRAARFSFTGESWAVNYPTGGKTVSHRGRYIEYVSHPQPDGRVDHSSHVGVARRVDEPRPCPPFFAGTIWYDRTKQFIQRNAEKARWIKQAEIDGIKTQVLEWAVPQAGDAFHGVVGSGRLWATATLRFYVAPQLGYALPRYEYVDSTGVVAGAFPSSGFKQVAPGVFFPEQCNQESYDDQGRLVFYERYTIKRTEKMNEPIPDEDFEFVLPKGTAVNDARPADPVAFRIGVEPVSTADLDALLIPLYTPRPWWTRTWLLASLIGAALAAALLLGYYMVRKRRQRLSHAG